jgi:hypothetical protein
MRRIFVVEFSDKCTVGFVCQPLENNSGWTFTLTTLLGGLLIEAEARYDRRDLEYTILGIEFGGNRPGIWYPGNRKQVSVRLSLMACHDPNQAYFQLAHEVIHLLSPTGGGGTTVLEEGLAHLFSMEMSTAQGTQYNSTIPTYDQAADLLRPLLNSDPEFIRKIRQFEPCLAHVKPEHLRATIPDGDEAVFNALCERFQDFEARHLPLKTP